MKPDYPRDDAGLIEWIAFGVEVFRQNSSIAHPPRWIEVHASKKQDLRLEMMTHEAIAIYEDELFGLPIVWNTLPWADANERPSVRNEFSTHWDLIELADSVAEVWYRCPCCQVRTGHVHENHDAGCRLASLITRLEAEPAGGETARALREAEDAWAAGRTVRWKVCDACAGYGVDDRRTPACCKRCDGTGRLGDDRGRMAAQRTHSAGTPHARSRLPGGGAGSREGAAMTLAIYIVDDLTDADSGLTLVGHVHLDVSTCSPSDLDPLTADLCEPEVMTAILGARLVRDTGGSIVLRRVE